MIQVDRREPASIITEIQSRFPDVTVEKLDTGDFVWTADKPQWMLESPQIAVERKTGSDFLGSLRDGRMWSQARRLREDFPRAFICITTPISSNMDGKVYLPTEQKLTGWDYDKVQRIICRLQLDFVPVFTYNSDSQFLDWLFRLYELSTKEQRNVAKPNSKRKRDSDKPADPPDES